jgi:hypothetical protein
MDVDTFIKRNVLLCLLMIESEIKKKISKQPVFIRTISLLILSGFMTDTCKLSTRISSGIKRTLLLIPCSESAEKGPKGLCSKRRILISRGSEPVISKEPGYDVAGYLFKVCADDALYNCSTN